MFTWANVIIFKLWNAYNLSMFSAGLYSVLIFPFFKHIIFMPLEDGIPFLTNVLLKTYFLLHSKSQERKKFKHAQKYSEFKNQYRFMAGV